LAKIPFDNPSKKQSANLDAAFLRSAAINRGGIFDHLEKEFVADNKPKPLRSGAEMYAPIPKETTKEKTVTPSKKFSRKKVVLTDEKLNEIRLQQHEKKELMALCKSLLNVNYDWLSMNDYPESMSLAIAKRNRDYWLLACFILLLIFLAGTINLVPAWVAGSSFGLLFVLLSFSVSKIRRLFFRSPVVGDLIRRRKLLEFRALNHIKHIEGKDGFAWKCERLSKYNSNLNKRIFQGIYQLSREKKLLHMIRDRKYIRFYLLLMIESEKAYKRLQDDFFKIHFKNLDQGIDDTYKPEPS